jgi:hypothetical protein
MIAYRVNVDDMPDNGMDYMPGLSDMLAGFNEDVVVAQLGEAMIAAQRVGWPGQIEGDYLVFPVPVLGKGVELGFMWRDATHYYVASPKGLGGFAFETEPEKPSQVRVAGAHRSVEWKKSQNGNPTAKIKGYSCTVFRSKRGPGYGGIISGAGGAKVFTKTHDTEDEVKEDITENFDAYTEEMK